MGYCWMHGFWIKVGHSSATCSFPREGHCKDATHANTKGDGNLGQGRPNPLTWQGMPADLNKLEVADNHLAHFIQLETSCANQYNLEFSSSLQQRSPFLHPKPCFTKHPHQPGHKSDPTWGHKHAHITRDGPVVTETTTGCTNGSPSFWTYQQPPLCFSPMHCRLQSLIPQQKLRGHSQWWENPLRVERPPKLTVTSQNHWWRLDHWPKN